jgi:hypothetical protein
VVRDQQAGSERKRTEQEREAQARTLPPNLPKMKASSTAYTVSHPATATNDSQNSAVRTRTATFTLLRPH